MSINSSKSQNILKMIKLAFGENIKYLWLFVFTFYQIRKSTVLEYSLIYGEIFYASLVDDGILLTIITIIYLLHKFDIVVVNRLPMIVIVAYQ